MLFRNLKKSSLNFIGKHFASILVNMLCGSLKITEHNKEIIESLDEKNQNYVLAFWHGKMIAPWYLFRNTNSSAIISISKDGSILASILEKWNYDVQRGSSNKGGKEVLESLILSAQNGKNVLITPDGPKGPIYKMKAGAVITAKKSGVPIIFTSVFNKKKLVLKSWDKFEIPYFFSEVKIKYSEPYYIDKNLSYDETDKMINTLENVLIDLENDLEKNC
ncbi:MAG: lysophospholipid acyltransferase family protein [Ignavibacteriae bacterium]|nr:lysophospholipid acyltransferase family protein [Ignavibacteriota bacterium]